MVDPERPTVSVIVIFLNAEQFLDDAVESVLSQGGTSWELLLVDDGSSDGSTALARRYAASDPRIRYVEHEGHANRGMSASRNLGVAAARGDWIALLDADDVWMPNKLEAQLALADEFPSAELIYGAGVLWFSWAPQSTEADRVLDTGFTEPALVHPPGLVAQYLTRGDTTPCTGSLLVRRATYQRLGGFEESFPGVYEDQVFYLKAALHVTILAVPTPWLLYRQHDGSSCAVSFKTRTHREARRRFVEWAGRYVASRGAEEPDVVAALHRELAPVVEAERSKAADRESRLARLAGLDGTDLLFAVFKATSEPPIGPRPGVVGP